MRPTLGRLLCLGLLVAAAPAAALVPDAKTIIRRFAEIQATERVASSPWSERPARRRAPRDCLSPWR